MSPSPSPSLPSCSTTLMAQQSPIHPACVDMLCNPSGRRLTQKSSAQIQPRDPHITTDPSLPGSIESMGHLAKCHQRNDVLVVSTYTCLWVGKHDRYRVHGTVSSACWCYQLGAQFVTSVCACVRYQIGAN